MITSLNVLRYCLVSYFVDKTGQEKKKSDSKGMPLLLASAKLMVLVRCLDREAYLEDNYGCGFTHTADWKQRH